MCSDISIFVCDLLVLSAFVNYFLHYNIFLMLSYQQVFLVFVHLFLHITIGRWLLLLTLDGQYWLQWHTMLLFGVWVMHVSWAKRLIRCSCCNPSIYFCFFFSISQASSILEKLILLSKRINDREKLFRLKTKIFPRSNTAGNILLFQYF